MGRRVLRFRHKEAQGIYLRWLEKVSLQSEFSVMTFSDDVQ